MADRANVKSIASIESFRSSLIVYIEKSCAVLDGVSDEAKQLRMWLQNTRTQQLKTLLKKQRRKLETLQQELFSDQLAEPNGSHTVKEMAVRKKKEETLAIEQKLHKLYHWIKVYDSEVIPMVKQVDKLRDIIDSDLAKGVIFLNKVITTLQDYAEMTAELGNPGSEPPADPDSHPAEKEQQTDEG